MDPARHARRRARMAGEGAAGPQGNPSPSPPPGGRARRGSRAQRAARPATLGGSSGPGAPATSRISGAGRGGRAGSPVASARRYRAAPGPRPEILLGSPGGSGPGAIARRRGVAGHPFGAVGRRQAFHGLGGAEEGGAGSGGRPPPLGRRLRRRDFLQEVKGRNGKLRPFARAT